MAARRAKEKANDRKRRQNIEMPPSHIGGYRSGALQSTTSGGGGGGLQAKVSASPDVSNKVCIYWLVR